MRALLLGSVSILVVSAIACGGSGEPAPRPEAQEASVGTTMATTPGTAPVEATAALEARSGSTLAGTATFVEDGGSVTLTVRVEHAPPGEHAVHIHETGDCSAPDGSSAGGHWNPGHMNHGQWGTEPHHLGDIGNLHVGEDGTGSLILTTDRWSIGTGADGDILGHAVIVHEKLDDFTTQPTGAAGGRIGCGVIRR